VFDSRVTITRDESNKQLEASIFSKLAAMVAPAVPEKRPDQVTEISMEDALRELLALENETK
jgi:hypothetical protein